MGRWKCMQEQLLPWTWTKDRRRSPNQSIVLLQSMRKLDPLKVGTFPKPPLLVCLFASVVSSAYSWLAMLRVCRVAKSTCMVPDQCFHSFLAVSSSAFVCPKNPQGGTFSFLHYLTLFIWKPTKSGNTLNLTIRSPDMLEAQSTTRFSLVLFFLRVDSV